MNRISFTLVLIAVFSFQALGQFRLSGSKADEVTEPGKSSQNPAVGLFGLRGLDMRHSLSVNYSSYGGKSLGMTLYTNSTRYKVAENLFARADVGFAFSPFGSVIKGSKADFSGIFLKRASVDYTPFKDFHISINYLGYPGGMPAYGYPDRSSMFRLSDPLLNEDW